MLGGEAAPLSGFGQDALELAREQLLDVKPADVEAGAELFSLSIAELGVYERARRLATLFGGTSPSARFCFEMLCARLAAHQQGNDLFGLLGLREHKVQSIRTSQVIDPFDPDALRRAGAFCREGVSTFKLKCGRSIDDELAFANRMQAALIPILEHRGESLKLRLDYNRALSIAAAHSVLERLSGLKVEWVEDPTDNPEEWHQLVQHLIPLAVDESLSRGPLDEALMRATSADTIVVKPMALGGFSAAWTVAQWAEQQAKKVCLSHLFDGPLAFEATAALAFEIQSPNLAAGLSAHAGLEGALADSAERAEFSWLLPDRLIVPNST